MGALPVTPKATKKDLPDPEGSLDGGESLLEQPCARTTRGIDLLHLGLRGWGRFRTAHAGTEPQSLYKLGCNTTALHPATAPPPAGASRASSKNSSGACASPSGARRWRCRRRGRD
ncbi:hypothetical protein FRC01_010551 [Tulasnella sp. 417]|nr:hypothetical protein FRC01_010551 [Tulasnella sp. 417]